MATNFAVKELPARIMLGKSVEFYGAMSPKFNGQEKIGPVWGLMQAKRIELGLPEGSTMIGATEPADSPEATNGLLKQFVGCVVDSLPAPTQPANTLAAWKPWWSQFKSFTQRCCRAPAAPNALVCT